MAKPRGSGTLGDEINRLDARISELGRSKPTPPRCVVQLTKDATLGAANTLFAFGDWVAAYDPTGMFHAPDANSANSRIQITIAGYYRLHYHSAVTGNTAAAASGKITRNAANTANSVAADARQVLTGTGDGAVLDAGREHLYLAVGDTLYWSNWCAAAATLKSNVSGVPTEITVSYLGSL